MGVSTITQNHSYQILSNETVISHQRKINDDYDFYEFYDKIKLGINITGSVLQFVFDSTNRYEKEQVTDLWADQYIDDIVFGLTSSEKVIITCLIAFSVIENCFQMFT